MKRPLLLPLALAALAVTGCDLFTDVVTEYTTQYITQTKGYSTVDATEEKIWDYSENAGFPICEITPDVLSVTLRNVPQGKTLYLVQHNTGDYAIAFDDQRTVVSTVSGGRSAVASGARQGVEPGAEAVSGVRRHFVGEPLPSLKDIARSPRSALGAPSYDTDTTSVVKDYEVGAKRTGENGIYIDINNAMDSYARRDAVLLAKGTSCYVWGIKGYYKTTGKASGCQIDSAIAQAYADKFDAMYPVITTVFGEESNKVIDYAYQQLADINDHSDTGEMVNIVVYDIGNDYYNSADTQTGVVGYFYAKDYFANTSTASSSNVISKSNVGKYFYIDSGFAVSNFDDTISTLAHEFQHMVNYNQKDLAHDQSPSAAYNEMLSMLCEDMMQEFLELEDYASPKNRIQSFNLYYYASGITEYRNDSNAALSYSTSYAFGAWLCRQYGGAALVQAMMANDSVDEDSIVAAVNEVNGTSLSFEKLFKQFLLALTCGSVSDPEFTHNQDAAQKITYSASDGTSYDYPMLKFNLWSSERTEYDSDGDGRKDSVYTFSLEDYKHDLEKYKYSGYNWKGPFLFSTEHGANSLRGDNGISIHGVGTTTGGSVKVTFSPSGASTLKLYLIIQ